MGWNREVAIERLMAVSTLMGLVSPGTVVLVILVSVSAQLW